MDFYRIDEEYSIIGFFKNMKKKKEELQKFLIFDILPVISLHLVPFCK